MSSIEDDQNGDSQAKVFQEESNQSNGEQKIDKNLTQKTPSNSGPYPTVLDSVHIQTENPQQNTFKFPNGVEISSEFDSGNLARCWTEDGDPNTYICLLSGDGLPYTRVGHFWTWFYFSVKGVPAGTTLTFSIRGMAQQGKLYKMGLRPVWRVQPNGMKWKPHKGYLRWKLEEHNNFTVTFQHCFDKFGASDTAYFAWTYPYSFQESLDKTQKLLAKYSEHPSVYIHREVLYYSRERRPMELITFTGKEKMTDEREDLIEGLFPESGGDPTTRPFKFDKPTIFLSSRVHPGETPASHVLNGIWNFLTNERSEQAKVLRDNFVFKVVPMLNPDGVYRGYYRLDTLAQNLNRYYINPSPVDQPTIWAVKKAIEQQVKYKKIDIYVDLHAHASKKGCFMFGNNLQGEDALKAMLLPKLISMNSLNFDFAECSFSDKLMNCKDKKDGLSREGCGRVSIMKLTGLPNCYTLECNYASGRRINHLSPKVWVDGSGKQEAEIPITDPHSKHYAECQIKNGQLKRETAPTYTVEIFEDIGRGFCIGLLDFYRLNPVSRIPTSNLKTLSGVQNDILAHFPIFIPKREEEAKDNNSKAAVTTRNGARGGFGARKAFSLQRVSQRQNNVTQMIKVPPNLKTQSKKGSAMTSSQNTNQGAGGVSVLSDQQQQQIRSAQGSKNDSQHHMKGGFSKHLSSAGVAKGPRSIKNMLTMAATEDSASSSIVPLDSVKVVPQTSASYSTLGSVLSSKRSTKRRLGGFKSKEINTAGTTSLMEAKSAKIEEVKEVEDIKNQVIREAGEKREISGSPKGLNDDDCKVVGKTNEQLASAINTTKHAPSSIMIPEFVQNIAQANTSGFISDLPPHMRQLPPNSSTGLQLLQPNSASMVPAVYSQIQTTSVKSANSANQFQQKPETTSNEEKKAATNLHNVLQHQSHSMPYNCQPNSNSQQDDDTLQRSLEGSMPLAYGFMVNGTKQSQQPRRTTLQNEKIQTSVEISAQNDLQRSNSLNQKNQARERVNKLRKSANGSQSTFKAAALREFEQRKTSFNYPRQVHYHQHELNHSYAAPIMSSTTANMQHQQANVSNLQEQIIANQSQAKKVDVTSLYNSGGTNNEQRILQVNDAEFKRHVRQETKSLVNQNNQTSAANSRQFQYKTTGSSFDHKKTTTSTAVSQRNGGSIHQHTLKNNQSNVINTTKSSNAMKSSKRHPSQTQHHSHQTRHFDQICSDGSEVKMETTSFNARLASKKGAKTTTTYERLHNQNDNDDRVVRMDKIAKSALNLDDLSHVSSLQDEKKQLQKQQKQQFVAGIQAASPNNMQHMMLQKQNNMLIKYPAEFVALTKNTLAEPIAQQSSSSGGGHSQSLRNQQANNQFGNNVSSLNHKQPSFSALSIQQSNQQQQQMINQTQYQAQAQAALLSSRRQKHLKDQTQHKHQSSSLSGYKSFITSQQCQQQCQQHPNLGQQNLNKFRQQKQQNGGGTSAGYLATSALHSFVNQQQPKRQNDPTMTTTGLLNMTHQISANVQSNNVNQKPLNHGNNVSSTIVDPSTNGYPHSFSLENSATTNDVYQLDSQQPQQFKGKEKEIQPTMRGVSSNNDNVQYQHQHTEQQSVLKRQQMMIEQLQERHLAAMKGTSSSSFVLDRQKSKGGRQLVKKVKQPKQSSTQLKASSHYQQVEEVRIDGESK